MSPFLLIVSLLMSHPFSQQLPAEFKAFAMAQTAGGKTASPAFMTHCCREAMQAQWMVLLDDDFLEAWKHGIVILCWDGVRRRFYPRIFTYSADYPEKCTVLLLSLISDAHMRCLTES